MLLQTMPTEKVKKIVITGTMGSGKSFVCNILKEKGYPILDLDQVAAKIREKENVKQEIIACFGEMIVNEKKEIQNDKLSALIFKDSTKRHQLEAILHQRVYDEMLFFFESHFFSKMVIVEMAMVFEFGWENYFDSIWLVSSEDNIAMDRLTHKRGYTKEKAKAILHTQISNIDKRNRADYVIMNNEDIYAVEKQLQIILEKEVSC
ncbi:MAG: dephospho-CoA kinase [Breznakia sp.]